MFYFKYIYAMSFIYKWKKNILNKYDEYDATKNEKTQVKNIKKNYHFYFLLICIVFFEIFDHFLIVGFLYQLNLLFISLFLKISLD